MYYTVPDWSLNYCLCFVVCMWKDNTLKRWTRGHINIEKQTSNISICCNDVRFEVLIMTDQLTATLLSPRVITFDINWKFMGKGSQEGRGDLLFLFFFLFVTMLLIIIDNYYYNYRISEKFDIILSIYNICMDVLCKVFYNWTHF